MRKLVTLLGAVAIALTASATAQAAERPSVICITGFTDTNFEATGEWFIRPHVCQFHEVNIPVDGNHIAETSHLRWRHWGYLNATATGHFWVGMYGPVALRLRLFDPRTLCGHTVFTRAHFRYHQPGEGLRSYTVPIDNCLR